MTVLNPCAHIAVTGRELGNSYGAGNGDGYGNGNGYGNGYGYGNGHGKGEGYGNGHGDGNGDGDGDGTGYGYGTGNGDGDGDGYGDGYGNGDGDGNGEAILEEMGIPNTLHHLFLPLSNESLELANILLNCNTSLEYESILGILELRRDVCPR